MDSLISPETRRNWERLKIEKYEDKLKARANKKRSKKTFIPLEYMDDSGTKDFLELLRLVVKEEGLGLESTLYTLGYMLVNQSGLLFKNSKVQDFLSQGQDLLDQRLLGLRLPEGERDLLGLVYQSLQEEGSKNIKGSYYTPRDLGRELLEDLDLGQGQEFLDPCCGSGSFLLSLETDRPENLYGIDFDPIAVMLSRFNLYLKYPKEGFVPNIYQGDFLIDNPLKSKTFDYIGTNPPWGALTDPRYKDLDLALGGDESFSLFILRSLDFLKEDGRLIFLLPESFLNVAKYRDLRAYLLENIRINRIKLLGRVFTDVLTRCLGLDLTKAGPDKALDFHCEEGIVRTRLEDFYYTENLNILPLDQVDGGILEKVFSGPREDLGRSIFALGIVTGDNKRKILQEKIPGSEPIYRGKDIGAFKLASPRDYIVYRREDFQQVAPDEIYRAEEKLVYKFISKDLVFAYDRDQRLFLNSANIILPRLESISALSLLGLLNSGLFSYLYKKLFNEVKILKGNLLNLPLVRLDKSQDEKLQALVKEIIGSLEASNEAGGLLEELDEMVYGLYGLTREERDHIGNFLKK